MIRSFLRSALFVSLFAQLSFACRSTNDDGELLNRTLQPSACQGEAPLATDDVPGATVFDRSSRCVFNRDVHSIHIHIYGPTFEKVLADGCADVDSGYGHIREFRFDGHLVPNVGVKVRGNTSRCNAKRQFKLKFDSKKMFWQLGQTLEEAAHPENKDRSFFGLEGISLRASANDPTMIRERASSRIFTHASDLARTTVRGAMVYRVSFAKVFVTYGRTEAEGPDGNFNRLINGLYYDYKGMYSITEHIDKTFLRTRLQIADEKLKDFYLIQADLGRASLDSQAYTPEGWKHDFVDGKKPEDPADFAKGEKKLKELIALLEQPNLTDDQLADAINIDSVVNYTASAWLAGHWDSLLANRNNDFLYWEKKTKRWQLIAWDLDNTLGNLRDSHTAHLSNDIYAPGLRRPAKLFSVLFAPNRTTFRAMLRDRLKAFTTGFYAERDFNSMIDWLRDGLRPSLESWENPPDAAFDAIKDFAKDQRAIISTQL